jgi:hypothetical protein
MGLPSWYDYIPVVGPAVEVAKGNGKQALIDSAGPLGPAVQAVHSAYDDQRKGLQTASDQSKALGERLMNFQMQGLNRAENYYLPAQQEIASAYGSPGALRGYSGGGGQAGNMPNPHGGY